MKLLLDSHAFVWMHDAPNSLSKKVKEKVIDTSNQAFLSVASVWELQIKIKLGKLNLSDSLENVIEQQRQVNDLQILPVVLSHALYLENLPFHHKDPFDRILIAQAIGEKMTLVSIDKAFSKYDVETLW